MKDKLINLIQNAVPGVAKHWASLIADHLIANDVRIVDLAAIKQAIKPKADSTLNAMKKADLIDYIRCLENNYNTAVWFNENQAKYVESLNLPKWIPVSERLPTADDANKVGRVWAVLKGEHPKIWHYILVRDHPEDFTHWMPLPEPPKEGE